MKIKYIRHIPSRRLILIFSGWSSTPSLYSELSAEGWDIAVAYDYSSLEFDPRILEQYSTVFVIAWSLGVSAAEKAFRLNPYLNRIKAAFAINGTTSPAHDKMGIPVEIYDGTLNALSVPNLRRFRRRISSLSDQFRFPQDSAFRLEEEADDASAIDRLKMELRNLREPSATTVLPWKRAYISLSDRIFSADNQIAAWSSIESEPQIIRMEGGHYLPLQLVINEVTPDHRRIADRFRKAAPTYDNNAVAQIHIARRLADRAALLMAGKTRLKVLEIGPGSGVLSKELSGRLNIADFTFIDLYPIPKFNMAEVEDYIVADAEEWMEGNFDKFDLIISASTIQWFSDPDRFFANAAGKLKDGGALVCSTFLPGNLAELDVLRPSPLLYRSETELRKMLSKHFNDIEMNTEDIRLDFSSPREALMHLKLTGVGGGSKANVRNLLTSLPPRPHLTYRTLYFSATL